MKKAFILMAAAAAIGMSSCSQDETKDVAKNSNNITFRTAVGHNSRGVQLTDDNITKMWVSAFDGTASFFSDKKFEKSGNEFVCNSNSLSWPNDANKELQFIAYSTTADDWGTPALVSTSTGATITGFSAKTAIADQADLVVGAAKGTKTANENAGVTMNLEHILSQIKIAVKNTDDNLVYHIKGIRIANVANKGDYALTFAAGTNLPTHAWSNLGAATTFFDSEFDAQTLATDGTILNLTDLLKGANADCGAMLIPQTITSYVAGTKDDQATGSYISLLINVKTKGGSYIYPQAATSDNQYGWAAVAIPTITWANGNKYVYTLDLSKGCGVVDPVKPNPDGGVVNPGGGKDPDKGENIFGSKIKFTVTVAPWTPAASDITVQ